MTVSDRIDAPLAPDAWRRRELGIFLRSRRDRMHPPSDSAGSQRRRAKGMRREEVAVMLGVSPSWYTKLEQGRDVTPSVRLLGRLADVLRLSGIEREQLMRLGVDDPAADIPEVDEAALPCARMIIDAMPTSPAFVLNARADYIACNRAARALFGDFETFAGKGNQLIALFLDDAARRSLPEWIESARSQVAMFRTAFARFVQDQRVRELVTTLLEKSPEFRELWEEYELPSHSSRVVRCGLLEGSPLGFHHFTFFADLDQQLRVEVFNPMDDYTAARMADLVATAPAIA